MSTQRSDWRASSTSHSSPICQPWFSPMMRRISGAASLQAVRAREHARDDVLQRQQPLRALPLGDLALERRAAGLDRRLLARAELSMSRCLRMTKIASTASSTPIKPTSGSQAHGETGATPYTDCGHRKQAST